MDLSTRSTSSYVRRNEARQKWNESETAKASSVRSVNAAKIKFENGAMLLAAVSAGDTEESLRLIKQGADVNYANIDGLTSLHQACIDENLPMVKLLVDNGATIDPCDNEGWTPLHAAASSTSIEIIRYLLNKDANLTAVNSEGQLPVDLAENKQIQRFLEQEVKKRGIDLDEARLIEHRQMLKDANLWKENGQIENVSDSQGATPLHVASSKGYLDVLQILLSIGADPNATDFDGWTPLHAAVYWKQLEIIEELLSYNASLSKKNNSGDTPAQLAADDQTKEFLQSLMIKYRIDDKKSNENPGTPTTVSPFFSINKYSPLKEPTSGILKTVKFIQSSTTEPKNTSPVIESSIKVSSAAVKIEENPKSIIESKEKEPVGSGLNIPVNINRPISRPPVSTSGIKTIPISHPQSTGSGSFSYSKPALPDMITAIKLPPIINKGKEYVLSEKSCTDDQKKESTSSAFSQATNVSTNIPTTLNTTSIYNDPKTGKLSQPPNLIEKTLNTLKPSTSNSTTTTTNKPLTISIPSTVSSSSAPISSRINISLPTKFPTSNAVKTQDNAVEYDQNNKKDVSDSAIEEKLTKALARISLLEQDVVALRKERDCLLKIIDNLRLQIKGSTSVVNTCVQASDVPKISSYEKTSSFTISRPPQLEKPR